MVAPRAVDCESTVCPLVTVGCVVLNTPPVLTGLPVFDAPDAELPATVQGVVDCVTATVPVIVVLVSVTGTVFVMLALIAPPVFVMAVVPEKMEALVLRALTA